MSTSVVTTPLGILTTASLGNVSPQQPPSPGVERASPTRSSRGSPQRQVQHRRSESDYSFQFLKGRGAATDAVVAAEGQTGSQVNAQDVAEAAGTAVGQAGGVEGSFVGNVAVATPAAAPALVAPVPTHARGWNWRGHRKSLSDVGSMDLAASAQRSELFRAIFAMPDTENLVTSFTCYLIRSSIPRLGKIYISENYICFQSKVVGIRTKVIIPIAELALVQRDRQKEVFYHGMFLWTSDQCEIFFEFYSAEHRNRCCDLIATRMEDLKGGRASTNVASDLGSSPEKRTGADLMKRHVAVLDDVHRSDHHFKPTLTDRDVDVLAVPVASDIDPVHCPPAPMHITCLTIGTRGDVQPYIALCKRLQADGHICRIATHLEYQSWIESHGIEFREVKGDPAELMQCCVENGMFTVNFIVDAIEAETSNVGKFRGWIDELITSAWEACQGSDLLIESPSAMAGIHIAEALAFPHPFAVTERHLGGSYNYMSYVLFEQILWKGTSTQINRWRKRYLNRPPTALGNIGEHRIPYLYFFSPSLVPPPSDWHDWIHMTGYWFLDAAEVGWEPPERLARFLRESEPNSVVYIGFGSVIVPDPDAMTRTVVEAVRRAGVRAIVAKGWSARGKEKENAGGERSGADPLMIDSPDFIYFAEGAIPHDWLFPQLAGVVHHGGCGTTGAGLRAGMPTAIRPYFGDQFFWAERVEAMGVGCAVRKLTAEKLSAALVALTTDEV
ncbi:Sterol 3-beta-glucosyltransferase [Irineochytrium annulatum]|nr:Sterol 3-beta-glucosyltransferase [Irineochytrium annulatum]